MTTSECRAAIESGALDERFAALYPSVPQARERYLTCLARHEERYGPQEEIFFFSTPGRTEIGGNHTDHQNGTVLAGAVSLDLVAAVSRNSSHTVRRFPGPSRPFSKRRRKKPFLLPDPGSPGQNPGKRIPRLRVRCLHHVGCPARLRAVLFGSL